MNIPAPSLRLVLVLLGLILQGAHSSAYEVPTHRLISENAFNASTARTVLVGELGISGTTALRGLDGRTLRPVDWLAEGSDREDDKASTFELARFRHHFYDPLYDQPLSRGGIAVGFRAYEWALEEPEPILRQSFSWPDARSAFLRALTAATPEAREQELAQTFRILGHVIHLVQDAAVPEHTRNDWHGGALKPVYPIGTPSLYEGRVGERLEAYASEGFLAGYGPRSFARLRDFWVTGDGKGLSEFTNRSFVSKATNFARLEEGATGRDPESGRGYPFPRLELARRYVEEMTVSSPGGAPITGILTFFGNQVFDLATGQSVENKRLTTFGIFDADLVARDADPIFSFNRYNVDAAAGILLRRAVGYSAGLLDHFFRTRLDVDVVADEQGGPEVVRLEGVNDGPDAMHDGRLLLYADDASGRRSPAAPLGAHDPVAAAPGAAVTSGLFELPPDTERLVAVYRGGLGTERPAPGGLVHPEVPGAVIGKVLGGVRVEEIFKGPDRWQIRTPIGLFPLPLDVSEYENVKWGDQPDVILAHTPLLDGAGGRVETYVVSREADGLGLVVSGATGLVEISRRDTVSLPLAQPPLVTTIAFDQTVRYRQRIARYAVHETFTWVPHDPLDPNTGSYVRTARTLRPLTWETLHEVAVPFTAPVPVRLDPEHVLNFGSTEEPYAWQLTDVAADARGRILGVVAIYPTGPGGGVTVPIFQLDEHGQRKETDETVSIRPFVHLALAAIWAIVDLKDGTVVASTADPVVTIRHESAREAPPWDNAGATVFRTLYPGLYRETVREFLGGPSAGTLTFVEPAAYTRRPDDVGVADRIETIEGDLQLSAEGWMRDDLAAELTGAGLLRFGTGEVQRVAAAYTYDCPTTTCTSDAERVAFAATARRFDFTEPPAMFFSALRARPAPGGERLVLLGSADRGGAGTDGHLVVWDPEASQARVRLSVGPTFHAIAHATSRTVMLWQRPFIGTTPQPGTYIVSLDGDRQPVFVPDVDLRSGFRLLDPRFLYRPSDLRFYRVAPPLRPTVLPAKLVEVLGKSVIGDLHVVAVP